MRFLTSVADAFLDRSPNELIGALMIAGAIALVMAGVYALGRRKTPCSPTVVGTLALAAGLSCMTVAAGYMQYAAEERLPRTSLVPHMTPPWASGSRPPNSPGAPAGFYAAGWSSGIHFVVAADANRNGRISIDEAAQLVRQADTDGDGSVDFRDIDRVIANRIRSLLPPPVEAAESAKRGMENQAPIEQRDQPSQLFQGEESFHAQNEAIAPQHASRQVR